MPQGICLAVYPCDQNGTVSTPPLEASDPQAVDISFHIDTSVATPPQDQLQLKRDVEYMLRGLDRLFLKPGALRETDFRPYYVQLVKLAQLGLAGPNVAPDIARRALDGLTSELIDNEGTRVKNANLLALARWAAIFSGPCLVVYALLRLGGTGPWIGGVFKQLHIDPQMLSCFMLLWLGCFLGVVLSYGVRTTTLTLTDVAMGEADKLLPQSRLLFAGALTMIVGILLVLQVIELKIGAAVSSADLAAYPMLAFVIGSFCGLSELALPGAVARKAGDVVDLK